MFDLICIFTTGGVVLWSKSFLDKGFHDLNIFVKSILLEGKSNQRQYNYKKSIIKWRLANHLNLVFTVVYQEILQLLYIDQFLEMLEADFTKHILPKLLQQNNIYISIPSYTVYFPSLSVEWEQLKIENSKPQMREFENTSKGARILQEQSIREPKKKKKKKMKRGKKGEKNDESPEESGSPVEERGKELLERKFKGSGLSSPARKGVIERDRKLEGKEVKEMRNWGGISTKISKKEEAKYDESIRKVEIMDEDKRRQLREQYVGDINNPMEGFYSDDYLDEDDEGNSKISKISSKIGKAPKEAKKGMFSKLMNSMKTYTGNKVLSESDLLPLMKDLSQMLIKKNVAAEIAESLCDSVKLSLLSHKTSSFTTVKSTFKASLSSALTKLLIPKKEIDILKEAMQAKGRGVPYSCVFIGVNGVGKSTSLAKVAYRLKHKGGLSVLIAACDNFRSGAVEQLKTHCDALDIPLFEKGYGDDPSIIAKEALSYAKSNKIDVVLIDTAGRMQDNEPLMKALAKLIHGNNPDVILFVGEALVGNDAIDQLNKFNKSLIDFGHHANPRIIDAIILTKFDTVDEKVGAAISMVYTTGKPIVFLGVGQKYPHLAKLNVPTVLHALLS